MKFFLVGYGKMGKTIAEQAQKRGHEIVGIWEEATEVDIAKVQAANPDACIEFTHPDAVLANLQNLIPTKIPIVCGTTGWNHQTESIKQLVIAEDSSLIFASNFSVGVNLLFKLNRSLAKWMNPHLQYDCFIEERHHNQKADAPSGTALSLAKGILEELERKNKLADSELKHRAPTPEELSIGFVRSGEIAGTHTVAYTSETDTLSIQHIAHNRNGFALGAVIAAEWIQSKKGFYEFSEIFE